MPKKYILERIKNYIDIISLKSRIPGPIAESE
jgi:hypothetical protein